MEGESPITLVHNQELSMVRNEQSPVELQEGRQESVAFRHSFWREQRERVIQALGEATYSPNRVHRFCVCGSRAWVQRSIEPHPRYRVISARCHDRWCEACQRERRWKIARNLVARQPSGRMRFVTLTLKSSDRPIGEIAVRLVKSFTRLRASKTLDRCFVGGAWFMEFTFNAFTGRYHPHLHVLTQGAFLPVDLLRRRWHMITGDSYVVDVREVKQVGTAAGYVVKYAGKLLCRSILANHRLLVDAIRSLGKAKSWSLFGTWRSLKLAEVEPDGTEWEYLEPFQEILNRARSGDHDAQAVVCRLRGVQAVIDAPEPGLWDLAGPEPPG